MTENEERLLDSLEKKNKEMQEDFRSIADYAEALKNVTGWLLDGVQENLIVELTLHKIIVSASDKSGSKPGQLLSVGLPQRESVVTRKRLS